MNGGNRQRIIRKGRGVVDTHFKNSDGFHVYDSGDDLYECTLNQTDISKNQNKFYVLQLLESDANTEYYVFTRWGRVGSNGQWKEEKCDLATALELFKKKFREKTGNHWSERAHFSKIAGKYELMEMDYETQGEDMQASEDGTRVPVKSCLPKEVQDLMELIGSTQLMQQTMQELEIDTDKFPLGKISKTQIRRGYEVLKSLEDELNQNPQLEKLQQLSNEFYTLIPHAVGRRRPPVIDSSKMLWKKKDMLDDLSNLEIAVALTNAECTNKIHKYDQLYQSLKCELIPLAKDDPKCVLIEEYVRNTHGPTHEFTVGLEEVFIVKRQGEEERYEGFKRLGNRQMLWHGSRVTNFIGILSQGLRIAPEDARITGHMFGRGIYLTSVCSKAATYCHPSEDTNNGLMLLCEVALGKQHERTGAASYMNRPEKGTNSTKGIGRHCHDPSGEENVDGVIWPKGPLRKKRGNDVRLNYPEDIIYDDGQCKMSYLVWVKISDERSPA